MNPQQHDPAAPISFEQLAELKRADRAELMRLPPDEAQAAVDQISYPRLWRIVDPRQLVWPGNLADSEAGDSDDAENLRLKNSCRFSRPFRERQ